MLQTARQLTQHQVLKEVTPGAAGKSTWQYQSSHIGLVFTNLPGRCFIQAERQPSPVSSHPALDSNKADGCA